MLSPFNASAFNLDDLYNPLLIQFYGVYFDVFLFITTTLMFAVLYVIIFKSTKEMGTYKWYLCHQLFWSYAFNLHLSLWKPIPLWPFYVGFSAGIYRNCPGMISQIQLILLIFFSVGQSFAIYVSVLHRYIQAIPQSYLYELYSKLRLRFLHYFILFIFMESLLCIPLMLLITDINQLKNTLIKQNPAFLTISFAESSLFGFDRMEFGNNIVTFLVTIVAIFLFVTVLIIGLYSNFLRILSKNKSCLSSSTLKLQTTLFRSLTIQMFFAVILLWLPVTLALFLSIFGFNWIPKFSICAIMITVIHPIADFIVIIYTVKTYRLFFYQIFLKTVSKIIGFTSSNNSVYSSSQIVSYINVK